VLCKAGKLLSNCTCPYDATCKHAVAVVLEYLDCLKKKSSVPIASTNDRRFELLDNDSEAQMWDEEDDEDSGRFRSKEHIRGVSHDSASFLEQQTKEQLISLIKDLAERHPAVLEDLHDKQNLSEGNIKQLVRSIQKEIREVSSEPGWTNHWKNEGYIPDYSHVKERLKGLLDLGHADAVITLGQELLEQGAQQVSMSHDEGETSCAIGSCMEIIFKALAQSSLPPVEKMLWAVEAERQN